MKSSEICRVWCFYTLQPINFLSISPFGLLLYNSFHLGFFLLLLHFFHNFLSPFSVATGFYILHICTPFPKICLWKGDSELNLTFQTSITQSESSPGFENMTTKSQVILKSNKKMCHLLWLLYHQNHLIFRIHIS